MNCARCGDPYPESNLAQLSGAPRSSTASSGSGNSTARSKRSSAWAGTSASPS